MINVEKSQKWLFFFVSKIVLSARNKADSNMSKPRIFKVKFHNPNGVFYNGQTMKGTIKIENDEEIDLEGEKY